ncbi:glucose 1-dehydrogenase [Legionella anisa]|uniref:3-oxoacyl-ACP reductase n=1 Tax=Legionella anisa TaxID=28082 RepID=A0AAX0WUW3_9GAMM|nr:glucose 1-dehydrogenase [Legionella anisa]AWN74284.1 3-oxoacyl-ACP reductase [Legionella anisa]KTC72037.1 acetyoacetyl CoA reductase [Legionella anisa]MBN5934270.1 glucose 1-dehydrogenase [Legionella anisa]MCW8425680.1 glucose 1-dehydrogenase [Legionella anisa]MCW8448891.1 glucose 1-dehydrogenase [Legionella anisa]
MEKKTVLITGALTGIGKAVAFAFAREGANIVISGRKQEVGESLAKELRTLGVDVVFIRTDVRYDDEVKALIDDAVKRFGHLDVAVNNAGTEGIPGPFIEQTIENYHSIFDTNVFGVFLCIKYELKAMMSQGSGCIINLSSIAGQKGLPGASIYCASKHAVEGFTKVAAVEAAAANVRVNAVAPGPISTDMFERFTGTEENKAAFLEMVPLKRAGRPEEVAQTIVFLASDKASYITGKVLGIDGGMF